MLRPFLASLAFLILTLPSLVFAKDDLAVLESAVAAGAQVQPKLLSYHATLETTRLEEIMARLTEGASPDVKPPPLPVINKFWQRNGERLVYAGNSQASPSVEQIDLQILADLAVDLNEVMLPPGRADQRRNLVEKADITSSDVALAENLIHRLEITFNQATDLEQAFYTDGIGLPQEQIRTLVFDVDGTTGRVNELGILADNELQLTVEIRYIEVPGGHIPERFQVTSPDGKIDDLFETKYTEVDGFILPQRTKRTIRRPDLRETTEVLFKNYRINQPVPAELQNRLNN